MQVMRELHAILVNVKFMPFLFITVIGTPGDGGVIYAVSFHHAILVNVKFMPFLFTCYSCWCDIYAVSFHMLFLLMWYLRRFFSHVILVDVIFTPFLFTECDIYAVSVHMLFLLMWYLTRKSLLRERKRHTDRGVSSTTRRGTPCRCTPPPTKSSRGLPWVGYPHAGVPPARSDGGGTQGGVPPYQVPPPWLDLAEISPPTGPGWGTPPPPPTWPG